MLNEKPALSPEVFALRKIFRKKTLFVRKMCGFLFFSSFTAVITGGLIREYGLVVLNVVLIVIIL
ncbi:MAG: hypothetical protein IKT14_07395, partial [Clostridiales bacterium]|nr:hypothetical protein [Clostridiales bacterium]